MPVKFTYHTMQHIVLCILIAIASFLFIPVIMCLLLVAYLISNKIQTNDWKFDATISSLFHSDETRNALVLIPKNLLKRKLEKDDAYVGEVCCICLDSFIGGSTIRVLVCKHVFHRRCIDLWLLKYQNLCPVCRDSVDHIKPNATITRM